MNPVQLTPFQVAPKAMHELIVMPQFADILDENGNVTVPSDENGDWSVMDGVAASRQIIDLFGNQNILKRRDATCKLIYSPVGKMGNRDITTDKVYAATEDCQEEFYQGAFVDYSEQNFDVFAANIMPMLSKGFATDIYTNKYFGDVSRTPDATGTWSWNKFNGIFTYIARYITDSTIPSSQSFTITVAGDGSVTPTQAYNALAAAYAAQSDLMDNFDDADKCFYVDKKLRKAYFDYVVQSGVTNLIERMQGQPDKVYFEGVEVKAKKWDAILKAINGHQSHAIILTLRGNFIFGTDSTYGGGPLRNEAIRVWYSMDDDVWRRQVHMKAGTNIVAPQFVVVGLSN